MEMNLDQTALNYALSNSLIKSNIVLRQLNSEGKMSDCKMFSILFFKRYLECASRILRSNFVSSLMLESLFSRAFIQQFIHFKCYQSKAVLC